MTRFTLKIANAEFEFGLGSLFVLGAGIVAALILLAYVDALHESMRQGEALRQAQHTSDISGTAIKTNTARRVALVSK